ALAIVTIALRTTERFLKETAKVTMTELRKAVSIMQTIACGNRFVNLHECGKNLAKVQNLRKVGYDFFLQRRPRAYERRA
ncbi:MAG: hypothetical protein ACE5HO_19515, partial [bacterium]